MSEQQRVPLKSNEKVESQCIQKPQASKMQHEQDGSEEEDDIFIDDIIEESLEIASVFKQRGGE